MMRRPSAIEAVGVAMVVAVVMAVVMAVLMAVVGAVVLLPASAASAHPLGNFSINQYVGLTLSPDHVAATVVVDSAEIPTRQERDRVDVDADGTLSAAELSAHAARVCVAAAAAITARVDRETLMWTLWRSRLTHIPGASGLPVSRLECTLRAAATLDLPATVRVDNGYLADRVGWREMTATARGLRLLDSPLPHRSVSDELRGYPADVLASTLDIRSAVIRVAPGAGPVDPPGGGSDRAAGSGGGDPLSHWLAAVDRRFHHLAGGDLTPLVGLLAALLALVLGAGHAALPGHGKTVLAAYLAGRRGRPRDALTIAATVTLTHTGAVLALGLVLTAGTAVAGERVLAWLGVISGVVVLAVGAAMLTSAVRGRHGHAHHHAGTDHAHHHAGPGHAHHHAGPGDRRPHDPPGRRHRRGRPHRLGLAGIGLAGGLVPSPSALVVLLAAIGLGRTGFGVLLVLAYGLGMAATLTGAGLLLVALQRRLSRVTAPDPLAGGLRHWTARLHAATPAATGALVLLVGAGLAVRAAAGVG